jgi:hypothetical protein
MSSLAVSEFVVSEDELQVVAERTGVQSFPAVLAVRRKYSTLPLLEEAYDRATLRLGERGLLVDGAVHPELIDLVGALRRPERELAMRLVTPDGIARVTVLRSGSLCVLARKVNSEILLRRVGDHVELAAAVQALLTQLPAADAARIDPVGAPIEAMCEALGNTHDGATIADGIRALGCDQQSSMVIGSAFGSRIAFAEITYNLLNIDDDRIVKTPAAVGIFYTKRGRIVSAPSMSPSREIWSTLKGGSNHAISQAISQLIELSSDRWEGHQ